MSISLLRRLLMKEAVKDTAGSSGIMSINKKIADKVEQQLQKYVNDAMRQGVDLDTLSPEQLKMIVQMNKPQPPRVIAADSPEGRGITERLFGKQGEVVDMAGKKLDTSQGIMGGKSVKELMDSGQVSKGARGMKKSKKVQDREMFKAANERLTSDVDSIIKDIKSMEPITAMKEANSVIARKGKYKNLTPEQSKKILQDTEDHIFERDIPEEDFADGGRIGFDDGDRVNKSPLGYRPEDFNEKLGIFADGTKISGGPMSKTPTRNPGGLSEVITSTTPIKKSPAASRFMGSIFDFTNIEDEEETESKAMGGRAGFAGGSDMGTVADSKGKTGPSKGGYQGGGTGPVERPTGGGGGGNNNTTYDYTIPKQIVKQTAINTAKNLGRKKLMNTLGLAKFSNPIGIAMALKSLYDQTQNPTLTEEEAMGGGITGMANGGRAGFMAGGMGRRAFLKLLGLTGAGIAGAKTGLMSLAKKSEPVVEAVKETAQGVPPYFFKLVEKIKTMGDDVTAKAATKDREVVTKFKEYELTEDVATGEMTIQRMKVLDDGSESYYGKPLTEETYMNYKPGKGQADEMTGPIPDEYEEGTALLRNDREYAGDVVDESFKISDDVIEEAMSEAPSIKIKKAGGGIARMLGE